MVDINHHVVLEGDGAAEIRDFRGCYGLALYARSGDLKKGALLHYTQTYSHDEGLYGLLEALDDVVSDNPDMKGADVKRAVLLYAPDIYNPGESEGQRMRMELAIKRSFLGWDAEVRMERYDPGEGGEKRFVLDLNRSAWKSWTAGSDYHRFE